MIQPEDRKLDWVPRHDPRSLQFPARTLFRKTEPANMTWRAPSVPLDQGAEGACVGFGWTHEALTTPVAVNLEALAQTQWPGEPNAFARSVYREAQHIDEWDGVDYEGTSVNAGAKVMRSRGLLKEWRWSFGVDDVILSIVNIGPVVLGIPWHLSMYHAPNGIVEVHGEVVGGHCIMANAVRKAGVIFPDEVAIGWVNSWGPTYGQNGRGWIRRSALGYLLGQQGEAAVPVRRSYGR